jgi:hypothetical protein
MPKLLLVSLIAAVGILGVDVVRVLWWEDPGWWRVVVVAIDLAAMALFASLYRRNEKATQWARTIALVWGVLGCLFALLSAESLGFADAQLSLAFAAEGAVLLVLYIVLRLPSSKVYLASMPPNTSLERTR